jgi:hypothetical protein
MPDVEDSNNMIKSYKLKLSDASAGVRVSVDSPRPGIRRRLGYGGTSKPRPYPTGDQAFRRGGLYARPS